MTLPAVHFSGRMSPAQYSGQVNTGHFPSQYHQYPQPVNPELQTGTHPAWDVRPHPHVAYSQHYPVPASYSSAQPSFEVATPTTASARRQPNAQEVVAGTYMY